MSLDAGYFLFAWMSQDIPVGNIIGTGAACRCYPLNVAMGKAFPRVTYLITSEGSNANLTGRGRTVRALAQVDTWAEGPGGYATARELAAAILGTRDTPKLDGFRGSMGGLFVQACLLETGSKEDMDEPPENAGDSWKYRVTMRFRITYDEG